MPKIRKVSSVPDPDWDVLNDWIAGNHPETWEAVRYLHLDYQYDCFLEIWKNEGSPII